MSLQLNVISKYPLQKEYYLLNKLLYPIITDSCWIALSLVKEVKHLCSTRYWLQIWQSSSTQNDTRRFQRHPERLYWWVVSLCNSCYNRHVRPKTSRLASSNLFFSGNSWHLTCADLNRVLSLNSSSSNPSINSKWKHWQVRINLRVSYKQEQSSRHLVAWVSTHVSCHLKLFIAHHWSLKFVRMHTLPFIAVYAPPLNSCCLSINIVSND